MCVAVAQWCPTLCDTMDYSLPGSSFYYLQVITANNLETYISRFVSAHKGSVLFLFVSNVYSISMLFEGGQLFFKMHALLYNQNSVLFLFVSNVYSISMKFSRQKYWRGLPFPSPGDLSDHPHCRQILFHLSHQGSPRASGLKILKIENSLMVQWLGFHASTVGGRGLNPGWGTKILYAAQQGQK